MSNAPFAPRRRPVSVGRTVSLLDRPWISTWGASFRQPLALPTVDDVHRFLHRAIEDNPSAVIACRLDRSAMRWVPVAPSERAAHVGRLAVAMEDPAPGAEREQIRLHTPPWDRPEPFKLMLGSETAVFYYNHGIGDGGTLPALLKALIECDPEGLVRLEPRVRQSAVLMAVAKRCVTHPADTARFVRTGLRLARHDAPRPAAEEHGQTTPTETASGPGALSSIAVSFPEMTFRDEAQRWRDEHAPDVSVAATVICAIYLALRDSGLDMDPGTFHLLFNARKFVAPRHRERAGNLAKGLDLAADMSDPRSITAATTTATNTFRIVPAVVASMIDCARPRAQTPNVTAPGRQPLRLNLSWIARESKAYPLPWLPGREKTAFGVGCAVQPYSIDINTSPMGNRYAFAATFDAWHADPQRVQAALDALHDIRRVLATANLGSRAESAG